jgi:hypothetical protein
MPPGKVKRIGMRLATAVLTALPMCGLVVFFEATRPAKFYNGATASAHLTSSGPAAAVPGLRPRLAVAKFKGVSAELRDKSEPQVAARPFSAIDAVSVFGGMGHAGLRPGAEAEFITKDHRRIALKIVNREPVIDQAFPDNSRLLAVTRATTATLVSFAWGSWIYLVEVTDKGIEPEVVVQKVL